MCTDWGQYQLTIGRIKKRLDFQLTYAAYLGFLNASTYFAQTVAYDTAEWAASGFKGQGPFIFSENWREYISNTTLNALGEFMGTFSDNFTEGVLGLDLCQPPNFPELSLEFALQLPGLLNTVGRPKPTCSWTDIVANWDTSYQSLSNVETIQNIRSNFQVGGNDISFGIGAHMAFFDFVAEKRFAGVQERLEGQGYRSVTDFISGTIETPAQTVQRSVEHQLVEAETSRKSAETGAILNNAFNLGWAQLGVVTASTFTNVLLSRLLQKVAKGLIKTSGSNGSGIDLFNPLTAPLGSLDPQGVFATQYSDLKTPHIVKTEAQDLLTELSACPGAARTVWNCAMDETFATGLRQGSGLTVRQMLDQGFLHSDWQLIPSTRIKENQDPTCKSRAFCVANLRKLRLARVLPIGWELAADSPANQRACTQTDGCITLGEAISHFDDCNEEGQLDATHPYCHLVDPNWVLTVFPAQCQTRGFGNQLLAGTGQRVQECQDTTTCLRRDQDGNCIGGYGYCMAEQTFWQFDAPSCQAQFASCRTFTPRGPGARPVSYLRSTLDYGSCNEGNVGCMWYARFRNPDRAVDSSIAWDAGVQIAEAPLGGMDRVFFDKNVVPCDASEDGCSSLRRVEAGKSALNLVPNGSFEDVSGSPEFPVGWGPEDGAPTYVAPIPTDGIAASHGAKSLFAEPSQGNGVFMLAHAPAKPLRQYVLSFSARRYAQSPRDAAVYVEQYTADDERASDGAVSYFQSSGCSDVGGTQRGVNIPSDLGDAWTRFACTFVTSAETERLYVRVQAGRTANESPLIDAIQLEESETPTNYVEGLSVSLATVNMRVPPDELACTGNAAQDHPLCGNFAQVCRQAEAGCQGYRPADDPAGGEIPAVLTSSDACPAECVGYAEYRKLPSAFDLTRSPDARGDDPEDETAAFFVPQTALQCSAEQVGCELFTNLDAASQGGETEMALRYLRACEQPDANSQTYYTWEGSDTSGYQLKTWSLKRDTAAPLPQGPRIAAQPGLDGVLKDPMACNEGSYLQALDPDCRQFYDPQGSVFYRFESQTVLSSDTCRNLRKEGSTRADCEKTGGTFQPATNQCVYQADLDRSIQCNATFAGCRAYVGTQGRAQEEVFVEEFLTTSFQAVGALGETNGGTIALSEEAILVGDASLRVVRQGSATRVFIGPMPLESGALYELSFWAKTPGQNGRSLSVTPFRADGSTEGLETVASIPLSSDWQTHRAGPFSIPATIPEGYLAFDVPGVDTVFFDKIRVERVRDLVYAVKDAWNTPASCDRTPEGTPVPQAMLGCRAYTDRNGNTVAVRQFTRLCRETAIGCTAYVNTRNTPSAYGQSWEHTASLGTDPEVTVASADRYEYYIENEQYFCSSDAVSCRAFGKPNYTADRSALNPEAPFTTVYLKDDPANYDEALCSEPELFCEAYSYSAAQEQGTAYFRAPSTHACEYRRAVSVQATSTFPMLTAGTYDGWFRAGSDIPCYPDRIENGGIFGILLTGDPGFNGWAGADPAAYRPPAGDTYQGWAGTCPEEQAECTEFRDVNDESDPLHPLGRPYFVVNNSDLGKESCGGVVDPGRGCVLFRDTSDPRALYSTAATYQLYQERQYNPVAPVDCAAQPDHASCLAVPGACTNVRVVCNEPECEANGDRSDVVNLFMGRACQQDSECGVDFVAGTTDVIGTCVKNDANTVIQVNPDRACSEWLSCSTSESVYDPQTGQYRNVCSSLALCHQSGGAPGGDTVPFCGSYVDRTSEGTVLQAYNVLTSEVYASRETGFGAKDYSGASIPDQFQVMDTELAAIGALFAQDPTVRSRSVRDYRLVVTVPIEIEAESSDAAGAFYDTVYGAAPAKPSQRDLLGVNDLGINDLAPFACVFKPRANIQDDRTKVYFEDLDVSFGLRADAAGVLSANGDYCWLAVDQGKPPNTGVEGGAVVSDNRNMLSLIQRLSQTTRPELDQVLSHSLPDAQCKAAPEADSPFGNAFVTEWDGSVNPPRARDAVAGYTQSNFCEFGEECSCTYKRVQYGGPTKFYEPLSTNVVNAVCVGGPRESQPCIVDAGVEGSTDRVVTSAEEGTTGDTPREAADPSASCGPGGTCRAITGVTLARGVVGQCLQYDLARTLGQDTGRYECLQWSPVPFFAGPGDAYHWVPSAGFQPPQSSGRYYCTSPVRAPRVERLAPPSWWPKDMPEEGFEWVHLALSAIPAVWLYNAYDIGRDIVTDFKTNLAADCGEDFRCASGLGPMPNSKGTFAGEMKALFYADWFTSDGSCTNFLFWGGCTGNEKGATIDGTAPKSSSSGERCENIDDEGQPFVLQKDAMRLVTTGLTRNRSYAEYAILFNPNDIAQATLGFPALDREVAMEYSMEDAIASFSFEVPKEKIGCGYTQEWADVAVADYDGSRDEWVPVDRQWHAAFQRYLAEGGGVLDRRRAKVLTQDGSPDGIPVKMDCVVQTGDDRGGDERRCFVKTWQLDYRSVDQDRKFLAFSEDIGRNGLDHLSRSPVYGACDASHPYFSIRAVFENTNRFENEQDAESIQSPDQLVGPFQFVGLWVTACHPGADTRYIYMTMDVNTADICRELAETISKDTHEVTAFTDRNSAGSGLMLDNGINWNSTNIPFGASLATADAGTEPLYMSGVRATDINPLNPPTFTYSGQTYFSSGQYPTSNWGMLSNIFARIYRVYGYYPRGVTWQGYACTDPASPNFAQWCPPIEALDAGTQASISQQFCGFGGKCLKGGLDASDVFSQKVCNSFSGVNRGLDCTADPDICHSGAVTQQPDGVLSVGYGACLVNRGAGGAVWEALSETNTGYYRCSGTCPVSDLCSPCSTAIGCSRASAIQCGAFRCSEDSVRGVNSVGDTTASYCTRPTEGAGQPSQSPECPLRIDSVETGGDCIKPSGEPFGTCKGHPWAQCEVNADCHYTIRNYWPSGDVNSLFDINTNNDGEITKAQQYGFRFRDLGEADPKNFYAFTSGLGGSYPPLDNCADTAETGDVEACLMREAFAPVIPGPLTDQTKFFAQQVGEEDESLLKLYPGFVPAIGGTDIVRGGSITGPANLDAGELKIEKLTGDIPPYIRFVENPDTGDAGETGSCTYRSSGGRAGGGTNGWYCDGGPRDGRACPVGGNNTACSGAADPLEDIALENLLAHYAACEPLALMYRSYDATCASVDINGDERPDAKLCDGGPRDQQTCANDAECRRQSVPTGICRGGSQAGEICGTDNDCRPANMTDAQFRAAQADAAGWCNPVASDGAGNPQVNADNAACWNPANPTEAITDAAALLLAGNAPNKVTDTRLDNNVCTHPPGYLPRPTLCADPDDEYCGLFGYDRTENNSVSDRQPLPTDVTSGFFTPRFDQLNADADDISSNDQDYTYAKYYTPIPPQVAAPDMRTCEGGTCRIAGLGTLNIDGLSNGAISGGAGSHVATLRFYAWAAHEQMPLRRVAIDWGDGSPLTELPDAHMRNHKPYCETEKECESWPGLTCASDGDCRPGGGRCLPIGNCANGPLQGNRCTADSQCDATAGSGDGVCEPRIPFGNDADACEEQYFEFRHAYTCLVEQPEATCDATQGRCSRDQENLCSDNAGCQPGDTCLLGLAPEGGCFEEATSACRFTPRVLVMDNWGWCTGECRAGRDAQGAPVDLASSAILHLPQGPGLAGGCYDASRVRSNTNPTGDAIGINECSLTGTGFAQRPWIVFPGAVQVRSGTVQ
jgi:hypothetical protein